MQNINAVAKHSRLYRGILPCEHTNIPVIHVKKIILYPANYVEYTHPHTTIPSCKPWPVLLDSGVMAVATCAASRDAPWVLSATTATHK
jgi:hypothetical protein